MMGVLTKDRKKTHGDPEKKATGREAEIGEIQPQAKGH